MSRDLLSCSIVTNSDVFPLLGLALVFYSTAHVHYFPCHQDAGEGRHSIPITLREAEET